ncbi:MAG: hypothetical protein WGN25_03850 [Candidatus Electrothrix sp. GW3-4]|uniref:hypothetical protein n=1 Tax=Candidatus Electrothrix sp. GW3-4 TaxID=3126740 RepID=UPI0030CF796F
MLVRTAHFPLQESLVLLNPDRQRLHLLNPLARSVYEALEAGLLPDEITREIAGSRGESLQSTRSELDRLFHHWYQQGLTTNSRDVWGEHPDLSEEEKRRYRGQVRCPTICDEECDKGSGEGVFCLYDLVFRIRGGNSGLWRQILALYGHLRGDSEQGKEETCFALSREAGIYVLIQDNQIVSEVDDSEAAVLALTFEIAELWRRRRDEGLFIAHAAGVGRKKSCFLLPAKGGSGKSTLTAALLKDGFFYLSDEIIPVLRDSGHAIAHPFCLHIKQGSLDVLRPMYPTLDRLQQYPWGATTLRFLPPPSFHQQVTRKTWPVAQIIFPQYQEKTETKLQLISPVEALQHLIEAGCILKTPLHPETVAELVDWIQQRPAYTLRYSCLHDAIRVLRQLPDSL